jgi:hypothetical protein
MSGVMRHVKRWSADFSISENSADKINDVVALLVDQCKCGTPSEIKAAFHELQAALNAQLAAVTAIIATLPK